MVKVSRPIRELAWKAYAVRERLERENGRDPTLAEIAGELDVTVEEIVEAMESGAEVESLQKTIYQGENHDISLMDRIPEKRERAGKAAEPDFLGRAVGTTAREGAAAHLHALFSGHDAGADRRKNWGFRRCRCRGWKKKILRQMRMEKGLTKNTNPAEGRFSWEWQRKAPETRADKGRKERRSGGRRQKV